MFVLVLMERRSPCDMVGLQMPYCRERARQQGTVPGASVPPEPVLLRVSSSLDLWNMVFHALVQTQKAIYVLQLLSTAFFPPYVCSWELWAGRICLAVFTFQPRALFTKTPWDVRWEPYFGDVSGWTCHVSRMVAPVRYRLSHWLWQTALLCLGDAWVWLTFPSVWSCNYIFEQANYVGLAFLSCMHAYPPVEANWMFKL